MHLFRNIFRAAIVLALSVCLAGCYETTIALNGDWGDRVNLATKVACLNLEGAPVVVTDTPQTPNTHVTANTVVIVEERSPTTPSKFRYHVIDSTGQMIQTMVFKETKASGIYRGQVQTQNSTNFDYGWYNENTHTESVFLNLSDEAFAEAGKDQIKFDSSETYIDHAVGTKENLEKFFQFLDAAQPDVIGTCIPTF